MLVRFDVHVLGYAPGDEVDLPKEWADRLVPSHATKITKAEAETEPKDREPAPKIEVEAVPTKKR